ncbi:MAG: hypothetical protein ACOCXP_03865 [Candidatus Dojkabacteria bacterium]
MFKVTSGEKDVTFTFPKVENSNLGYRADLAEVYERGEKNCLGGSINPAAVEYDIELTSGELVLNAQNAEACSLLWVNTELPLGYNYILSIGYEYKYGYPIEVRVNNMHYGFNLDRFMLADGANQRTIFFDSSADDGNVIEVNAHLLSRGRFAGRSVISGVSLQYFPKTFLSNIELDTAGIYYYQNQGGRNNAGQRLSSYLHKVNNQGAGYYTNNQAYDRGWFTLTEKGRLIKSKQLDNWTNVWELEAEEDAYLIYLPQILQFGAVLSTSLGIMGLCIVTLRKTVMI